VIIDPTNFTLVEWADSVVLVLSAYSIPFLTDENRWKEWAATINLIPAITAFSPPNPYDYEDWRKWAFDFNRTVLGNT
jgi:hypothetical protein